jgi:hypothetical protein
VHRPHRHLHGEGDEKREEDEDLLALVEGQLVHVEDCVAAAFRNM